MGRIEWPLADLPRYTLSPGNGEPQPAYPFLDFLGVLDIDLIRQAHDDYTPQLASIVRHSAGSFFLRSPLVPF